MLNRNKTKYFLVVLVTSQYAEDGDKSVNNYLLAMDIFKPKPN
jgi:hypothetical protein